MRISVGFNFAWLTGFLVAVRCGRHLAYGLRIQQADHITEQKNCTRRATNAAFARTQSHRSVGDLSRSVTIVTSRAVLIEAPSNLAIHRCWDIGGMRSTRFLRRAGKQTYYSLNSLPSEAPQRLSLGLHRHTGSGDRTLWPTSWRKILSMPIGALSAISISYKWKQKSYSKKACRLLPATSSQRLKFATTQPSTKVVYGLTGSHAY